VGQKRLIQGNTATVLTVSPAWTTALDTTSAYVISKLPNVMLGASGVNVSAWGNQAQFAWSETNTFNPAAGDSTTPLPDATTQWQVCFKCHSSANTALATWNAAWSDLAKDFNPRNQSYHPVVAQAGATYTTATAGYGNTQLATTDFVKGWTPGDMMTCSDCHGNDDQGTGASHGPHASAVKYILKGPNTRWPTLADGTTRWIWSNYTQNQGTANGLFCLNCHSATLRSIPHSNDTNHQAVACTGCHLRLPHGGKIARLIRTVNTPAPYIDSGTGAPAAALSHYNQSAGLTTSSCGAGCNTSTHKITTSPTNSW
jgi:hypothetical protein